MKKSFLFSVVLCLSLFFVSCEDEQLQLVTFEDVALTDSIWNGSNKAGKFTANGFDFMNKYTQYTWGSTWGGFGCSSKIDTKTTGFTNDFSVIAGIGAAKSAKFAVAYDSATVVCNSSVKLKSIMLTNNTYAYLDMQSGSKYSKKFAANDWFKVTITGYKNKVKTASVDYYLADFMNGKSFISNSWAKVDISKLGEVDMFTFGFDSSDKGLYGVNTPKYVCVDNVEYSEVSTTTK